MKVTVNGKTLTSRVWGLLDDARAAAGVPDGLAYVIQGSYNAGKVEASAGTHDGGGVFDLSVKGLTESQQLRLVLELRKRWADSWIRSPKYGWESTGPHIHGVVADEPDLSPAAKAQVAAYNRGLNGLANKGRDPHPRPIQHPVEVVRLMAWAVGARKMIKPDKAVQVPGGKIVTLAVIDLPKGGSFECSLQVRMPSGVLPGEAHLARLGWGDGSSVDETGHNPIPSASAAEAWRTPVHHNIVGGGKLAFRIWLPPRADGKPHAVKFVAKAIRTH